MAKYEVIIDGDTLEVEIVRDDGRNATLKIDGVEYVVEATNVSAAGAAVVPMPSSPSPAPAQRSKSASRPSGGGSGDVVAPLAGLVLEVCVSVGQEVNPGDVLARLEAMKMENDIKASLAGKVSEILISQGDEVQDGQTLLKLEA